MGRAGRGGDREVTLNREKLRATYEDVLMRIALTELAVDEARALEAEAEEAPPDPRAIRVIGRAIRRAECRKFARSTLPRAARVAAWLLLTIYLALTVALAFHAGTRARFVSLMKCAAPLRAGANLDPAGPRRAVAPEGWKEKYYPAYIPAGWIFEKLDPVLGDVVYRKDRDHILQFGVYSGSADTGINFEGAKVSRVGVNGVMALAAENPGKGFTWVTWMAGDRTVVIYMDAPLGMALDVAASVREAEIPGKY
jgi:hypothetical protein